MHHYMSLVQYYFLNVWLDKACRPLQCSLTGSVIMMLMDRQSESADFEFSHLYTWLRQASEIITMAGIYSEIVHELHSLEELSRSQ